MKKRVWLLLVVIVFILFLCLQVKHDVPASSDIEQVVAEMPTEIPAIKEVKSVHALVVNFLTAVKEPYRPPLGDNEDVVQALTGGNRYGDVFIATNDPAVNERGQLVDRWGTPYHFHARSVDAIDVRSAGPDKILFSEDDVVHPATQDSTR